MAMGGSQHWYGTTSVRERDYIEQTDVDAA